MPDRFEDTRRLLMTQKMLAEYQKAFNKIDDMSEYRKFDRKQFEEIADRLTSKLRDIQEEHIEIGRADSEE